MAKRLTDTEKWKKPFLRGMKAAYKLLWLYILDECDHAGIWQVDFDVAQIKIGEKLDKDKAIEAFAGRITILDGGDKWFVLDFIEFQYGAELNPGNKAHNSVIKILSKYNLLDEDCKLLTSPLQAPSKPLASTLQGVKDKDKDIDKDKEQATGDFQTSQFLKFTDPETKQDLPFQTHEFSKAWDDWKEYRKQRKFNKYTEMGIKILFKDLGKYDDKIAIAAINKSIKNNWQGLFPEKITYQDLVAISSQPGITSLPKAKYHEYEQQ